MKEKLFKLSVVCNILLIIFIMCFIVLDKNNVLKFTDDFTNLNYIQIAYSKTQDKDIKYTARNVFCDDSGSKVSDFLNTLNSEQLLYTKIVFISHCCYTIFYPENISTKNINKINQL